MNKCFIFIRCQAVLFQVQQAKAGLMNAPLIEILKEVIINMMSVRDKLTMLLLFSCQWSHLGPRDLMGVSHWTLP